MNYDQVTHEPLSPGKRCCRTPGSGLEYDGHNARRAAFVPAQTDIPGRMDVCVELCKGARDEMVIGIHALNVLNHCKLSTNISIVVDSLVARLRSSTIGVQLQLAYR
jgi:hypothetical protein